MTVEERQEQGNIGTSAGADLNADARRYAASRGWALPDGSFPIRPLDMHGRQDLANAIRAVGRAGGSRNEVRRHIIRRARALGLTEMIPETWNDDGSLSESRSQAEDVSETVRAPVEIRDAASVGEVNFAQRLIEVVAVPYEQEATVEWRGEVWTEVFERGSFDGIEKRPNRVRANRAHDRTRTVGKAVKFSPSRDEGLVGDVRIAKTQLGDETLALADEDMLSVSVGFAARMSDQVIDKTNHIRRIKRAFLDHIAFVESPAYESAGVISVRDQLVTPQSDLSRLPDTPALDELLAWQASRRR